MDRQGLYKLDKVTNPEFLIKMKKFENTVETTVDEKKAIVFKECPKLGYDGDCGVCALMNLEKLISDQPLNYNTYTEGDIREQRLKMAKELINTASSLSHNRKNAIDVLEHAIEKAIETTNTIQVTQVTRPRRSTRKKSQIKR